MTIKYRFVTGEEVYVEVYGRFEKIMTKLDCASKSRNKNDAMKEFVSLNYLKEYENLTSWKF